MNRIDVCINACITSKQHTSPTATEKTEDEDNFKLLAKKLSVLLHRLWALKWVKKPVNNNGGWQLDPFNNDDGEAYTGEKTWPGSTKWVYPAKTKC